VATKKKINKPRKATKKATKKAVKAKKPAKTSKQKDEVEVIPKETRLGRFNALRRRAAQDYIMDPDQRSIEFWHTHPERDYETEVAFRTFREWAYNDGWTAKRTHLWEELEWRVHEAMKEKLYEQRLREIEARTQERDAMVEYLRPLRDEDGAIERYPMTVTKDGKEEPHPLRGLPVFPMPFKDMGDAVRSFVKFEQHLMVLRGESASRTEHVTRSDPAKAGHLIDPVATEAKISDDDIHAMSRALLRQRQPELALEAEFSLEDKKK